MLLGDRIFYAVCMLVDIAVDRLQGMKKRVESNRMVLSRC